MAKGKESGADSTRSAKGRHRSPNYPAVGLPNAVERVQKLYEADGKAGATRESAFKRIGFSSGHGQAAAVLSALQKFGLVEEKAGRIVPTTRAVEILQFPAGHERRAKALRDAALSPTIYSDLVARFAEHQQIPSDDSLRPELVADMHFNPKAVDGFLVDFRRSFEYAGLLDGNKLLLSGEPQVPEGSGDAGGVPKRRKEPQRSAFDLLFSPEPPQRDMPLKDALPLPVLMDDGTFQIVNIPKLTLRAFEFLKAQLDVYKDAIVVKPKAADADDSDRELQPM